MAAILPDFAAAVVSARPRATPLSMITMKNLFNEFSSLSYMGSSAKTPASKVYIMMSRFFSITYTVKLIIICQSEIGFKLVLLLANEINIS